MARPFLRLAAVALLLPPVLVTSASAAPRPVVVLAPLGTAAPAPSAAAVHAALAGPSGAAALGGDLTGEVVDVQSGVVLWQRSPAEPVLVASTQKLLIAAAALSVLGAGAAPTTTLESTGTAAAGVLTGDLYLRGGGDVLLQPTPSTGWPTTASLDGLAAALRATGITAVHGRLVADGSAFTGAAEAPGWRTSYVTQGSVAPVSALEVDRGLIAGSIARAQDPPYAAAVQLRAALARHGITVSGATTEGTAPATARRLAAVAGPPVDVEVQEMLQDSDNDLAEALGREVAVALHDPPTFAGAASAIVATLRALGLPTAGVHLADASGLSRLDGVTPELLVAVLRQAATTRTVWRPILAGLPVAAFSGTMAGRDTAPTALPAAGVVRSKTGNISGVTAVAGTVVDAHGRLLAFSFVTDAAAGLTASEAALDVLAAQLAGV